MKTLDKKQKRNYIKPQIENIKMDNEISIFMTSSPTPPGDPVALSMDHFSFNPFKLPKM